MLASAKGSSKDDVIAEPSDSSQSFRELRERCDGDGVGLHSATAFAKLASSARILSATGCLAKATVFGKSGAIADCGTASAETSAPTCTAGKHG